MTSPTADHPTRDAGRAAHPAPEDPPATATKSQFVRLSEIDAYADEVARQLKATIRRAVPAHGSGVELPVPSDLVEREVSAAAEIDDAHDAALADSSLVDAVGPSWSTRKVRAELGGVSPQAVHQRVARGTLWALPTSDGATVYPTFQFVRRNGRVETKAGLRAMFTILRGQDPWAVAVLLTTPAQELEDLSPVEWERAGGSQEALESLAHAVVDEWNRR